MKRILGAIVLVSAISCTGGGAAKPPVEPTPAPTPTPTPVTKVDEPAKDMIPDTPAGNAFRAWLEEFNSGDEARIRAFADAHKSPDIVDMRFREDTGGFDLVAIQKSTPYALTVIVKERGGQNLTAVGWFALLESDGVQVTKLLFNAIPPGLTAADMDRTLDAAERGQIIDAAVAKLEEHYVYLETAKKMGDALRAHQKSGDYDTISDARDFAERLQEDLRAISHDKHLRLDFSPEVVPQDDGEEREPTDAEKAEMKKQLEAMNCGFEKPEILDGNIGYLKFRFFGPVEVCGPKATEAFAPLAGVKALIVDLRENGGGQPDMVAFVTSYLFAKRTHLNDIYERKANKTTEHWTTPGVPGKKLAKQPVFVLTSSRTFSGAEEFTYNLKNLKRATIIGETTGGGAHPVRGERLSDHFVIGVPFARAINPITKTNWEGTGVEPDVKVAADQALEKAKELAAAKK